MRRLILSALLFSCMIVMFSCSESPTTGDGTGMAPVARPNFIELRPADVVQQHVLGPSETLNDALYKKPPPEPDPGGDDPNPNPANKYAYVVGISDYEGTVNDLQFCDEDALEMKSYLQSQGFQVMMDVDQNATADDITAGLQWLVDQAAPGDEIAFCYSGHGAKAPGYGSSLISQDLYYMTHGYVMQYFNAINCSKKMATLDCCVAGDFHGDVVTGTMFATASANSDSYDWPAFENGAWTYFWLEGVENQGKVYAEDAADYAEAEMKAWAKPYHLRVSPKHTDQYDGMFDM